MKPAALELENVDGLKPGDLIEEAGQFYKVTHFANHKAQCRTLTAWEKLKLGFAQWRRRHERKNGSH